MKTIKKLCKHPACRAGTLNQNGYCDEHQEYRKKLKAIKEKSFKCREYAYLYNSNRWRTMRLRQLKKQPLCEECLRNNRTTLATVADHVIPHKGDIDLFYNGKLQSLCDSCHSKKTAEEKIKK